MTSNWKPIETAPKNKDILLYAKGGHTDFIGVGHGAVRNLPFYGKHESWFWAYAIHPTHWQPLPDPPKLRKPRDPVDAEYSARRMKPKRDLQSDQAGKTLPYDIVL